MRTRKRINKSKVNQRNWYPIAKIMGIRWYMNRLEMLLLSIVAEHPDMNDPDRVKRWQKKDEDIYNRIWNALATCEAQIIKIKKIHKPLPLKYAHVVPGGGCTCDSDCASGWRCDTTTWTCVPGEQPIDDRQLL